MKGVQLKARILSQARIKGNYWHCVFSAPPIAKGAVPGQFINIRVSDRYDPLLRRPLSIHGVSGGKVQVLYEVIGNATAILAQKKAGECLDIIGPLGKGFDYQANNLQPQVSILIAGGMGVAPLMFLAEKLAKGKSQKAKGKSSVLIGAKTKEQLLCASDFKKLGFPVKVATDDGSRGFRGKVSDLLEQLLSTDDYLSPVIYSCGPKPMLKAVADICAERSISAQLSLEEHMSCGIGACLGCVVRTKEGFKRVCKEGPVFNSRELIW